MEITAKYTLNVHNIDNFRHWDARLDEIIAAAQGGPLHDPVQDAIDAGVALHDAEVVATAEARYGLVPRSQLAHCDWCHEGLLPVYSVNSAGTLWLCEECAS
jgi:hypothetical protein